MKHLAYANIAATIALLVLSTGASAATGPTTSGAIHAIARVVEEEGATIHAADARPPACHRSAPTRFACTFVEVHSDGTFIGPGSATVSYSHRHYYVGTIRIQKPAPL